MENKTAIPELHIQKQVSEDHDTECALKAGELIELGFMGEEFANYGTAYLDRGHAKYFICNQEQTMQRLRRDCLRLGLCLSRVVYQVERYQVPLGRNDFFGEQVRCNLAEILRQRYGKAFFQALHNCQQACSGSDSAWPILAPLLRALRNSLDEQLMQIVAGLAGDAYEMKKLSPEHFLRMQQWLEQERRNLEARPIQAGEYRRSYYGFASLQEGRVQYYTNASLFTVQQKRREKITNAAIVSPILQRMYVAAAQDQLLSCRSEFVTLLQKYLSLSFMQSLEELWALESAVDASVYRQGLAALAASGKEDALSDYLYYGHIWNTLE